MIDFVLIINSPANIIFGLLYFQVVKFSFERWLPIKLDTLHTIEVVGGDTIIRMYFHITIHMANN